MDTILNHLAAEAKQKLSSYTESLRIDSFFLGKNLLTMKDSDVVFTNLNFVLMLFENSYGFSFFGDEIDYGVGNFINRNAFDVLQDNIPIYLRVAIIDALYGIINREKFTNKLLLRGNLRQKARGRAKALLSQVPSGSSIVLLGAATEIIDEAVAKGCPLTVLDLDEQKIGLDFQAICIKNGGEQALQEIVQKTDYIVATGMLFATGTADDVFMLAREYKKKLILFMETGAQFGPQLCDYGAHMVLSEFFPYYDFFGDTGYLIFTERMEG